jgi:hypothetical protein
MNTEPDWKLTAAAIPVQLDHDLHLADSSLARAGGPDATLACAECGRAKWMHGTRHDTCGQFCWVTADGLIVQQLKLLEIAPALPKTLRQQCSHTLNNQGLAPYHVRAARQSCAVAINLAKQRDSPQTARCSDPHTRQFKEAMTLTDTQLLDIINELLDKEGIPPIERPQRLRLGRGGAASLPALAPLVERYLTITSGSRTCMVEHDHWEGKMICGNALPCPRHGGG